MTTTRTYRVRTLDAANFLHIHDYEAASARQARTLGMADTNAETDNAVMTWDVHGVTADGRFGASYFLHPLAR